MTHDPRPRRRQPARAALLGLVLGCALSGLGLLAVGGWRLVRPPVCAPPSQDCRLDQELSREIGARQRLFGGTLLLLSIGLWLLARRPEEDPADDP